MTVSLSEFVCSFVRLSVLKELFFVVRVLMMFQESLRVFQGCYKDALKEFKKVFKNYFKKFTKSFKSVARQIEWCFD